MSESTVKISSTASKKHQNTTILLLAGGVLLVAILAVLFLTLGGTNTQSGTGAKGNATEATDSAANGQDGAAAANVIPPISDPQFAAFVKDLTRKQENDPLAAGKVDAPVTMLQFADFSCPMCYQYEMKVHPSLQPLVDQGKLRIEYHHMVIFEDRFNSMLGARAGEAAGMQGKFWDFLKVATDHVEQAASKGEDTHIVWSDQLALELAKKAGVADLNKFQADYRDPQVEQRIRAASDKIKQTGVIQGTPGFIVNQRLMSGVYPIEIIKATIDDAAKTGK